MAKAAQQSAKLALDSEIGGVNTTVAQTQAQLDNASWELSQTTMRAPADGYVTVVALSVGDRALQASAVMSFIVENEITIIGMFSQNGFQTIKIGAPVDIVFDNDPGRIHHAKITAIAKGIGQGQIAASGMIARTNAIGGATTFPVAISIPDGMSRELAATGNVRKCDGICRKCRGYRPPRVNSGLDQRLYRLPIAAIKNAAAAPDIAGAWQELLVTLVSHSRCSAGTSSAR